MRGEDYSGREEVWREALGLILGHERHKQGNGGLAAGGSNV